MILVTAIAQAQKVGEIEFEKVPGSMAKSMRNAPKRIYIAEFFVNYQMAYSQTSIARGGREFGGGYRGDAKATLNVAIPGVDPQELQNLIDELYKTFVDRLKSEGFEIVSADEAGKTDQFSDWDRKSGGELSQAQFPGYLGTAPSGFDYFIKKTDDKGREKRGMGTYQIKLSNDLNGAIVAKVNLAIPFVEEAEGKGSKLLRDAVGGVAKVVIKPNLRLAQSESVQIGKMSGASVVTSSEFFYKESLRNAGGVNFKLKKDVEIDGVFEEKKYKASESADTDLWGSDAGHLTIFHFSDKEIENTQPIPCDPQVYVKGVREVSTQFIKKTLEEFMSVMNN